MTTIWRWFNQNQCEWSIYIHWGISLSELELSKTLALLDPPSPSKICIPTRGESYWIWMISLVQSGETSFSCCPILAIFSPSIFSWKFYLDYSSSSSKSGFSKKFILLVSWVASFYFFGFSWQKDKNCVGDLFENIHDILISYSHSPKFVTTKNYFSSI